MCMTSVTWALSMQKYTLPSLFQHAQWIVHASVIKAQSSMQKGRIITTFTIKIHETLKDQRNSTNTNERHVLQKSDHQFSILGGSYQGLTQKIPGASTFEIEDEVILFLRCLPSKPCTPVGFSQGVWRMHANDSMLWQSDFEAMKHDTHTVSSHADTNVETESATHFKQQLTLQQLRKRLSSPQSTNTITPPTHSSSPTPSVTPNIKH